MKRIRKKTYYFLISFIVTSCIILCFTGMCAAYENITRVAYGEQKAAVSFNGGKIRIMDFEFDIPKIKKTG